jgi:hypothetical protein
MSICRRASVPSWLFTTSPDCLSTQVSPSPIPPPPQGLPLQDQDQHLPKPGEDLFTKSDILCRATKNRIEPICENWGVQYFQIYGTIFTNICQNGYVHTPQLYIFLPLLP